MDKKLFWTLIISIILSSIANMYLWRKLEECAYDSAFYVSNGKFVELAKVNYLSKVNDTRNDLDKSRIPMQFEAFDSICISLTLKRRYVGGDAIFCFDRNGKLVWHRIGE